MPQDKFYGESSYNGSYQRGGDINYNDLRAVMKKKENTI